MRWETMINLTTRKSHLKSFTYSAEKSFEDRETVNRICAWLGLTLRASDNSQVNKERQEALYPKCIYLGYDNKQKNRVHSTLVDVGWRCAAHGESSDRRLQVHQPHLCVHHDGHVGHVGSQLYRLFLRLLVPFLAAIVCLFISSSGGAVTWRAGSSTGIKPASPRFPLTPLVFDTCCFFIQHFLSVCIDLSAKFHKNWPTIFPPAPSWHCGLNLCPSVKIIN